MSLKDSKDAIEQLYGDAVLKHFPNYETFWVKFIGNPYASQVGPYEYALPSEMNTDEKSAFIEDFERLRMVHYSLFCHFAGACFQHKELEDTEKINKPNERYFRHWEHYELGHFHLGSVFYMHRSLWKIVLKLNRYPGRHRELEPFLTLKGETALVNRIRQADETVKTRRDQAVHYGRLFTLPLKNKFYVPLNVQRDMKWSDSAEIKEWIETVVNLKEDIAATLELSNDLHEILIGEYEKFIIRKGIKINLGRKG